MGIKSLSFPTEHVPVRFKHNHKVRDVIVATNKEKNPTKVKLASGAVYPLSHLEPV
jgi:hypothetical protein